MAFYDQAPWRVRLEWGLGGVEVAGNGAGVTVVVDVLSFTTAVDIAVGRGATVYPFRWRDERAAAFAAERGAILASHDRSAQFSLSPSALRTIPEGTRLVLPSPNGATLAFASRAPLVVAACLRNASTVASWIQRADVPITVIAAGERWPDNSLRPAIEDLLGAGAVIASLAGSKSPEARTAEAAYRAAVAEGLGGAIRDCSSGRELVERGFAADVALAADLDASRCIPMLEKGAFMNFRP